MYQTKQLQQEILRLKEETGIRILAHSYQSPEILEIADLKGDSFALSAQAAKIDAKTVILCGVRFMADTVKILSPDKTVILPVPEATCPMAEQISPETVLEYKAAHPDHAVVAYVNTTTELKAVCDVCVTSSSALKIVSTLPQKNILFIPDKNLGGYIKQQLPEKNIFLLEGYCPVHNQITEADVLSAKDRWQNAKLLIHPECPPEAIQHADLAGSTADIMRAAAECDCDCIIGTEKSIAESLSLQFPDRKFHLLSKKLICPDMRLTTLMDVYRALTGEGGERIEIEESKRLAAKKAIDRMIELGK